MFSTDTRLKILFVMPPCLPTPPKGYGGIEAVAAALLPELRQQGAHITLTTPDGSTVKADVKHELTKPLYSRLSHSYNFISPDIELYVTKVMQLAWDGDFDIIHDFSGMLTITNTLAGALPGGQFPAVVQTIHGPIEPFKKHYDSLTKYNQLYFTAISNSQLTDAPNSLRRKTKVIYNGINPSDFKHGDKGDRLLVLGRLCSDKGQDQLVDYISNTNMSLDIAGTVAEMSTIEEIEHEVSLEQAAKHANHPDLKLYKQIRPHIDGERIRFYGNVGGKLKQDLLSSASALVMPNRWAEPFGMVAIEAMASGTPVVAMGTGALPELVIHGETGYLANSFEELTMYLQPEYINRLDPHACRNHVKENFSTEAIAKDYMSMYKGIVAKASPSVFTATAKQASKASILKPVFGEQVIRSTQRKKSGSSDLL